MTALALTVDPDFDPIPWAIGRLIKARCNRVLGPLLLDEEVIVQVRAHPLPLRLIPQLQAPTLAVHRLREGTREREMGYHEDADAVYRIDYVSRAAPLDLLPKRWPLLGRVWREAWRALRASKDDALLGGLDVLCAAGVVWLDPAQTRVVYAYVDAGDTVYPSFQAEVAISSRPVDLSELPDLLEMGIAILEADRAPEEQPAVRLVARTDEGDAAVDDTAEEPWEGDPP